MKYSKEDCPAVTYLKLKNYQKKGIDFALQHNGRVILGDEMGVGKTLQAIWIASIYKTDWPLLIICPSSLKLNWKDEILKWLPEHENFITEFQIQIILTGKDTFEKNKKVIFIF